MTYRNFLIAWFFLIAFISVLIIGAYRAEAASTIYMGETMYRTDWWSGTIDLTAESDDGADPQLCVANTTDGTYINCAGVFAPPGRDFNLEGGFPIAVDPSTAGIYGLCILDVSAGPEWGEAGAWNIYPELCFASTTVTIVGPPEVATTTGPTAEDYASMYYLGQLAAAITVGLFPLLLVAFALRSMRK